MILEYFIIYLIRNTWNVAKQNVSSIFICFAGLSRPIVIKVNDINVCVKAATQDRFKKYVVRIKVRGYELCHIKIILSHTKINLSLDAVSAKSVVFSVSTNLVSYMEVS